jgi:prevent-host-death family protein
METPVSATDLARRLGDYLARVRYRRESFVVEKNGKAVARVIPASEVDEVSMARAFSAWCGAAPADPSFAEDLNRVAASDRPPEDPWAL